MARICIDIGNTTIGVALMQQGKVCMSLSVPAGAWSLLADWSVWRHLNSQEEHWLGICSVVPKTDEALLRLIDHHQLRCCLNWVKESSRPKLNLAYANRSTLGLDRLVLIHKAYVDNPGGVTLIVDAGTALSLDYIVKGQHQGGMIAPGFHKSFVAMYEQTVALPMIGNCSKDIPLWGQSTEECMQSGVVHGASLFIRAVAQQVADDLGNTDLLLWATGGNSPYLQEALAWDRCDSDLIFEAIELWLS